MAMTGTEGVRDERLLDRVPSWLRRSLAYARNIVALISAISLGKQVIQGLFEWAELIFNIVEYYRRFTAFLLSWWPYHYDQSVVDLLVLGVLFLPLIIQTSAQYRAWADTSFSIGRRLLGRVQRLMSLLPLYFVLTAGLWTAAVYGEGLAIFLPLISVADPPMWVVYLILLWLAGPFAYVAGINLRTPVGAILTVFKVALAVILTVIPPLNLLFFIVMALVFVFTPKRLVQSSIFLLGLMLFAVDDLHKAGHVTAYCEQIFPKTGLDARECPAPPGREVRPLFFPDIRDSAVPEADTVKTSISSTNLALARM